MKERLVTKVNDINILKTGDTTSPQNVPALGGEDVSPVVSIRL